MLVKSTTGGSAWSEIAFGQIKYGYCMAMGSLIQAGDWDHDDDYSTPELMAISKSTDDGQTWNTQFDGLYSAKE